MWCKLSTNFVVIDQYWCEVNDRTPIYVDWDFNSWFAQPNMPCPTRFEHEHIQTWLLLLNMRDDLHPIDTIRLLAVIKHYVDTWFLYIWYGFKKSPLTKTQQRISCKVNHESSICGADDQAESPLADSRPASHHKLCQPLQLRHPPGPDPIPSCSVHCANTFLSIIQCEFIHTGDAMQGDVRAVNTPIQLNSMHNSINNTQTFW